MVQRLSVFIGERTRIVLWRRGEVGRVGLDEDSLRRERAEDFALRGFPLVEKRR